MLKSELGDCTDIFPKLSAQGGKGCSGQLKGKDSIVLPGEGLTVKPLLIMKAEQT